MCGLEFVAGNGLNHGGPHVVLKQPRTVKSILGDGNCLFRSFSYIITGSEEQYRRVREVILNHMVDIEHVMLFHHLDLTLSWAEFTNYIIPIGQVLTYNYQYYNS